MIAPILFAELVQNSAYCLLSQNKPRLNFAFRRCLFYNSFMEQVNPGKNLIIQAGERQFARIPVKTRLITTKDNLEEALKTYLRGRLQQGDLVFLSEKMTAASQGRAVPVEQIKPSPLAVFLSR